jgi:uncharacterized protein (TIRG00374 family)
VSSPTAAGPSPRRPGAAGRGVPNTRRSVAVGLVIGLPVSAVFLWLAVRKTDVSEAWDAVTGANAGLLVAAVAAMAVVYLLQGRRWHAIAGIDLRRGWYPETVVAGVAVNNVLPGRLGDILRARWLSVDSGLAGGRAFATVIVDRAFDVAALVLFLCAGLLVATDATWLRRVVVGGLVLLVLLVVLVGFARGYTRTRPRSRRARRGLVRRLVRDTLEGLAEPLSAALSLRLGALSVAAWGAWTVAAWLVARAVGIDLSPLEVAFITGALNLGVAIPSSPGFIGTYQWLAVSALGVFSVDREDALAFAILVQAVWYVPTTVVGGAFVVMRFVGRTRVVGAARAHSQSSSA